MANSILSNNPTQLLTKAKVNVTDWVEFTPVFGNFFAVNPVGKWRRVGDTMEISASFDSCSPTGSLGNLELPGTFEIDGSKLEYESLSTGNSALVGVAQTSQATPNGRVSVLASTESDTRRLFFSLQDNNAGNNIVPTGASSVLATGEALRVTARVPIQGWSSEAEFLAPLVQPKTAFLQERQSTNVSSNTTFVAGSYVTNELNTLKGESDFLTLTSNQIRLSPGRYLIKAKCPYYKNNSGFVNYSAKSRIYNVTDAVEIELSQPWQVRNSGNTAGGNDSTTLEVEAYLEIDTEKIIEVQSRVSDTTASITCGVALNFGDEEVYTQVKITKLL